MPEGSLTFLQDRLIGLVGRAFDNLARDPTAKRLDAWEREMERMLARYIAAGYASGRGRVDLQPGDVATIKRQVGAQLKYLSRFAQEMREEFRPGQKARAEMYAESVKSAYWRGKTFGLDLPGYPAEGTQCKTRCGCEWVITTLDADKGDYDARWRRTKSDSCPTCLNRAGNWSRVRIRGGERQ